MRLSSFGEGEGIFEFGDMEIALVFQVAKEFPTLSRSARGSLGGVERLDSVLVRDLIVKLDSADDTARERGISVEVMLTPDELALLIEGGNMVIRWLGEVEFRTRTGFDTVDAVALLRSLRRAC